MHRSRVLALCATLALAGAAQAADFLPWRAHEGPFSFAFGNDIDSHQQTRLGRDGNLFGFLYVRFTGVVTRDGYPVATHVDCNTVPDCTVGWRVEGLPASGTFLYHPMHDHPVFLVARADIPQPGSHAHFHWLGAAMPTLRQTVPGYLLQTTAVDKFCFFHHGAEAASGGRTCRANGGLNVDPGTDISTHLNIVTSPPPGM